MIAHRVWTPVARKEALEAWWSDEFMLTNTWTAFLERRRRLINAIPMDAAWWRVAPLSWYDLRELHALPPFHVDGATSLFDIVERAGMAHGAGVGPTSPTSEWNGILLFGHARLGPFTVIEGNHRLLTAAYRGPRAQPLELSVHVALSERDCQWHAPVGP